MHKVYIYILYARENIICTRVMRSKYYYYYYCVASCGVINNNINVFVFFEEEEEENVCVVFTFIVVRFFFLFFLSILVNITVYFLRKRREPCFKKFAYIFIKQLYGVSLIQNKKNNGPNK